LRHCAKKITSFCSFHPGAPTPIRPEWPGMCRFGCGVPCQDGASPKNVSGAWPDAAIWLASVARSVQPPVSCSAVCQKPPRRPSASPLPSRKSRRMRASLAMLSISGTTCAAPHFQVRLAHAMVCSLGQPQLLQNAAAGPKLPRYAHTATRTQQRAKGSATCQQVSITNTVTQSRMRCPSGLASRVGSG